MGTTPLARVPASWLLELSSNRLAEIPSPTSCEYCYNLKDRISLPLGITFSRLAGILLSDDAHPGGGILQQRVHCQSFTAQGTHLWNRWRPVPLLLTSSQVSVPGLPSIGLPNFAPLHLTNGFCIALTVTVMVRQP